MCNNILRYKQVNDFSSQPVLCVLIVLALDLRALEMVTFFEQSTPESKNDEKKRRQFVSLLTSLIMVPHTKITVNQLEWLLASPSAYSFPKFRVHELLFISIKWTACNYLTDDCCSLFASPFSFDIVNKRIWDFLLPRNVDWIPKPLRIYHTPNRRYQFPKPNNETISLLLFFDDGYN